MKILRSIYVNAPNSSTSYPDIAGKRKFDAHSWPFKIEKGWTYVDNLEEADIVPFMFHSMDFDILKLLKPNQIGLGLSIFHIGEALHEQHYKQKLEELKKIFPNILIVHKNSMIKNVDGLIYYDCMFNRTKLYYTEYEIIEKIKQETDVQLVWEMATDARNYTIPRINEKKPGNLLFLAPGLKYQSLVEPRMRYRAALTEYLTEKYSDLGMITSKDNFLYPEPYPENNKKWLAEHFSKGGGFWLPIGNSYYENTYLSIYVETLTVSAYPTKCITEKTFEPLIKGHFILPFSYAGFVQDLRDFGFELPDFIDYSYDEIQDNDKRFSVYLHCIDKCINYMRSHGSHNLFEKHIHSLHHNKILFFKKPYDKLYDKVKHEIYRLRYKVTNHNSNL